MTIEHNAITDPNIHEPKGVAAASNGEVYVADGAGSGAWTNFETYLDRGWENVAHSGAAQVFTTTASKLAINGSGAASNSSYLPPSIAGSANLWDTANNKITPIAIGDAYEIRLTLPVTAVTGSPTRFILEADIGGGVSPSNLVSTITVPIYKSPPFTATAVFSVYSLATFLANGCQLFLSVDASTSAAITDPSIFITTLHRNL